MPTYAGSKDLKATVIVKHSLTGKAQLFRYQKNAQTMQNEISQWFTAQGVTSTNVKAIAIHPYSNQMFVVVVIHS